MLNLEFDNDGKWLKTAGDSLCTDVPPSSEKIGRGSPEVQKKNSRKGKLNEKNSCTPLKPKKYSCYGLKKIHTRNFRSSFMIYFIYIYHNKNMFWTVFVGVGPPAPVSAHFLF